LYAVDLITELIHSPIEDPYLVFQLGHLGTRV